MKKRILFIVGTRPEAIKLGPLYIKARGSEWTEPFLLATGQHTDMLASHLSELGISPDAQLFIDRKGNGGDGDKAARNKVADADAHSRPPENSSSLCGIGAQLIEKIGNFIESNRPDCVIVQGDTSSAFFGALAAFYAGVPCVHIEAGLRSHDPRSPFPEEAHRKMIATLSDIHIAPSEIARQNLLSEGVVGKIFVLGNTVTDTLALTLADKYENKLTEKEFILVTAHRRESGEREMSEMLGAVRRFAEGHPDMSVIFPVHPSKRVRLAVEKHLKNTEGVILTPPLPLYDFHNLEYRARFVLSDSGGVQEECSAMGVPVIVMRENTEREAELLGGKIILVGRDSERILAECEKILSCPRTDRIIPKTSVCEKILATLRREL
ncbi:MAG: UDP-N-acetylglucosamine 2-epimerase (non-hydrolyzing) [Clostridia bacterium]|nr:UDP-N-acetylglucosamine 2-epimerase (non-hydrolyzing) [Clostridia bacterium]